MSTLDLKLEEYLATHKKRDNALSQTELASLVATSQGFPARMDIGKAGCEAGKIFPVGPVEYWNKRYVDDPEQFEWYQRWSRLKIPLEEDGHVRPSHTVLHVGCGSSRLAEDMYADGYHKQYNIDFSHVVIDQQLKHYRQKAPPGSLPGVEWMVVDVTDMSGFSDAQFHAVIDKGTLDTICCGEDYVRRTDAYLTEVARVLKPGGNFVVVSHGEPPARMPYLTGLKTQREGGYGWDITKKHVKKESIMAELARRGEEEEERRVEAARLEAEAKAELAALEAAGKTKEQVEAERKAEEDAKTEAQKQLEATETPAEKKARLKAERKAKKKSKKKKKRKVHQETKADGTVIETVTDPRSVHYIYFCTKPRPDEE